MIYVLCLRLSPLVMDTFMNRNMIDNEDLGISGFKIVYHRQHSVLP